VRCLGLEPKVRAAIGTAADVLMIDATATIATVADNADIGEIARRFAQASANDPHLVPDFVYIKLEPVRIHLDRRREHRRTDGHARRRVAGRRELIEVDHEQVVHLDPH
jgi:hypothetical protein